MRNSQMTHHEMSYPRITAFARIAALTAILALSAGCAKKTAKVVPPPPPAHHAAIAWPRDEYQRY